MVRLDNSSILIDANRLASACSTLTASAERGREGGREGDSNSATAVLANVRWFGLARAYDMNIFPLACQNSCWKLCKCFT